MEEAASMQSSSQEFCLRWNNFHSSLISALDGFKNDSDFVDVTLACEGQYLKAHKMLLSACSVFFRDLLKANPCQHPIIILPPEVRFSDLEKMLRFIYQGEVNVQQEHLARFLKTAEMLKIRGLAEDGEKQKVMRSSSPRPPDTSSDRQSNIAASPKRPRLSVEGQASTSDESRIPSEGAGPSTDGDSEMIPVKQEMVELKECDFDPEVDTGVLLPESYLKESSVASTSSNSSMNTPSQSQPSAPPPPGPLLPSYVPPPQIKSQDDSTPSTNPEDYSQGSAKSASEERNSLKFERWWTGEEAASTVVDKWSPGQTPKSTLSSRSALSRSRPWATGRSPTFMTPMSPSPSSTSYSEGKSLISTPKDHPSPIGNSPSPSSTGPSPKELSKSIWHPPSCTDSFPTISNLPSCVSIHPVIPHGSQIVFTPISCDICSKTFTSVSNLNKHKRVQHSGEQYLCPICQRRFRSRYYIKDHVNLCAAGKRAGQGPSPNSNGEIEEIAACGPSVDYIKRSYGKWKPEDEYCVVNEKVDDIDVCESEKTDSGRDQSINRRKSS